MKIIFLDIDGVLASLDYIRITSLLNEENPDEYGYAFDPRCVKNLEYILKEVPRVKIVISSSWKTMGLDKLRDMWKKRNLPGKIMDITSDCSRLIRGFTFNPCRGMEIEEWLHRHYRKQHRWKDFSYVIIDDDHDILSYQSTRFVHTNGEIGLTVKKSEEAIDILNRDIIVCRY
jgi:hypothetical protein